jgi:tetratricopeptide (TPR) repeat protein
MHALRLGVAVLLFGLVVGQEARAGIYNLAKDRPKSGWAMDPPYREKGNPASPGRIRLWRADLASVPDQANVEQQAENKDQPKNPQKRKTELRLLHEKQEGELNQRRRDGVLSPSERVSLSGCLLRLGRWPEAMQVLEEGLRTIPETEPARFLLLLNLATAYWQNEDLRLRAIDKQTEALKAWPEQWPDWDQATLEWYRWAEKYNLELMRLRQREVGRTPGTLDALFPKVRFTGAAGRYEAGSIALEQWNELPRDAEQLVTQLMVWQPRDPRLYWLYGELLNARGEVLGAYEVLDYLLAFEGGGGWPDLRRHRSVLQEAKGKYQEQQKPADGSDLLPPPPPPEFRMPDWRTLAIGFLVGVVVTLLAGFQLREWRRRSVAADAPDSPAAWEEAARRQPTESPGRPGPEATRITRPEQG